MKRGKDTSVIVVYHTLARIFVIAFRMLPDMLKQKIEALASMWFVLERFRYVYYDTVAANQKVGFYFNNFEAFFWLFFH